MDLKANMENSARPVILCEMIPPKSANTEESATNLASIRELTGKVDGINIEQIISRNFKPSLRLLAKWTGFYQHLSCRLVIRPPTNLGTPLPCPIPWWSRAQDRGT